mgnify:CR=1 FL=1
MGRKYCPFKFNANTLDFDGNIYSNACLCEKEYCELWEENTGTCAFRTGAYLKGIEVHRSEIDKKK